MASLYAKCPNSSCGYLNNNYINQPTRVGTILELLEKEHKERSPNCPVKTEDLLVATPDPESGNHPGTSRIPKFVHVRRRSEPEPSNE